MIDVLNWCSANPPLAIALAIIGCLTLVGVADGLGNIGWRRG
jgi:hypothetical protein